MRPHRRRSRGVSGRDRRDQRLDADDVHDAREIIGKHAECHLGDADFSDLEIGPDGCLYLLSDKSCTIARLDDLPPGGGTAALLDAWRLGDLDGKPEGLAFTAQGRAIVGLDTRKPRGNLVLLEPAVAQLRGRGQSLS